MPTHIERSGDLLTIQQDVPWLSRLLMLPLLLGSGYLFRIFFLSVGDVLGGVKESELLAGQIICLVGGLLIGVPGLMGFLIRNSLVIDKAQGKVTKFYDYRLFSIPSSFDLSHVSLITITWEDLLEQNKTGPDRDIFNVNLVRPRDHHATMIAFFRTLKEATDLANELSVALGIHVKDLSDTEPDEDCDPEQLDSATPSNPRLQGVLRGSPRQTNTPPQPSARPPGSAPARP
ncbi:hypothetical protein [Bradyrhizobium lablabi]|uniref:PH domain-containing protein n=2 Tax=Bradyrhizobium TaxID=374 RepID=A0ABY0QFL5_9BRAD|nr:hypothetical protein [Bradyrhizobium lablabi]SDK19232.1 hypothetical protein SAMN05444163_7469 [Bradyrhizobium ottawaense]SEE47982.1 hypothetical protein SAMN05444171_7664 [Bradyrhizobium lablabi]